MDVLSDDGDVFLEEAGLETTVLVGHGDSAAAAMAL